MKSLLDPTFRYVPSSQTDIRKTFARVRREMRQRERPAAAEAPSLPRVTPLFREKRVG